MKFVQCSIITRQQHLQIHMRRFDVYIIYTYMWYMISLFNMQLLIIDKIPYPVISVGVQPILSIKPIHWIPVFRITSAGPQGVDLRMVPWRCNLAQWTQEHWQFTLLGTNIFPPKNGIFESMIFRTSRLVGYIYIYWFPGGYPRCSKVDKHQKYLLLFWYVFFVPKSQKIVLKASESNGFPEERGMYKTCYCFQECFALKQKLSSKSDRVWCRRWY